MKKRMSMLMMVLLSPGSNGEMIFIEKNAVKAFDVALTDFKKNHSSYYSAFIEETKKTTLIDFVEYGENNKDGRPVAYGRNISYEIENNSHKIIKCTISYGK